MTDDKDLKRLVRSRMRETGEVYTQALAAIRMDEAATVSSSSGSGHEPTARRQGEMKYEITFRDKDAETVQIRADGYAEPDPMNGFMTFHREVNGRPVPVYSVLGHTVRSVRLLDEP